jgi:two-component system response regulator RegA
MTLPLDDTSKQSDNTASLLLIDDDEVFRTVQARSLKRRGYIVQEAESIDSALTLARANSPEFVVLDLKLAEESGLQLIPQLLEIDPGTRIVMLTGYASIATAIEAIKLGAIHYLAKPVDTDQIIAAFAKTEGDADFPVNADPMSINRLEWEHLQRVLAENNGNISATARALKMHRRTLQRKLGKHPVKA